VTQLEREAHDAAAPEPTVRARWSPWPARAVRHWAFLLVLAFGTALRVLAWVAYQPALFYPDSVNYLANTHRVPNVAWHPPGYPWFLDAVLIDRHLAVVTAVHHLLLLGDGVLLYLLLLRLGCGRVVATLATAPILLDAYQVQIEQYILSEAPFETLLVLAVVAALWPGREAGRRPAGLLRTAAVSACVGLAVLVRLDAIALVLPLLGWVVWSQWPRGWRWTMSALTALVVALAMPVGVVMGLRSSTGGGASITGSAPIWLYARVAGFANCTVDAMPPSLWQMCPTGSPGSRPGPVWFQDSPSSPVWVYLRAHPGHTRDVEAFARRVIRHQPLDYAHAVVTDFAQQFRPTRAQTPGGPEVRSWQFRLTLAPVDPTKPVAQNVVDAFGTGSARIDVGVARFLRAYQRFGYLPGPVSAALLALSVIALVVRRRHPLAPAVLLVAGFAVLTVLTATATVLFSWRYMLPTLALYPVAGAMAWTMLRRPNREPSGALEHP